MIAVLFGIITATIIVMVFKSLYLFSYYKHVPGPRPRIPLFGYTVSIRQNDANKHLVLELGLFDIYKMHKNDGMAVFFTGNQEILYLFKPSLITEFFKENSSNHKANEYEYLKVWLGNGILVSSGDKWKNDRKMINPCFTSNVLETFIPLINDETEKFVRKLNEIENDKFIDIRQTMVELAMNILLKTVMGVTKEYNSEQIKEYSACLHSIHTFTFQRIFNPLYWNDFIFFKSPLGKLLRKQVNTVHQFTENMLQQRKKDFKLNEIDSDLKQMSLLNHFLSLQHFNKSITDEDIREQMDNFIFAGHDPAAICLSWTLMFIANHSAVQQKLKEEMNQIFGDDKHRHVFIDDIERMTYTECVIKESLRLRPPPATMGRKATKEFFLNGFKFRKETNVYVDVRYAHQDPETFKNPNEFIPERFTDGNNFNGAFMPFMLGPRSCVGQRFAFIEMKIILAHIFRNYKIKCLEKLEDVETTADLNVKPMSQIRFCFTRAK